VGHAEGFDCRQHGKFRVTDTALATNPRGNWEAALERAKRQAVYGEWPTITSHDFNSPDQPPPS
jgi:hypothetical protein